MDHDTAIHSKWKRTGMGALTLAKGKSNEHHLLVDAAMTPFNQVMS